MTITAKVIEDSMCRTSRLTTIELHFPYIILAQLLMHRMFSRNSQSNRAIPVKKLIQRVKCDPYTPVFRANKPGMVAGAQVSQTLPRVVWSLARSASILAARAMTLCGVHKETTNRLLLPFMHVTTVVTSTEWENFFQLRIEDNAQPEIQELASAIKLALNSSMPKFLEPGEWHLPYVKGEERTHPNAVHLSVARCARVSFLNHDSSNPSIEKDLALYHDLITSKPVHGSPAEHPATPIADSITHSDLPDWAEYADWEPGVTHLDKNCVFWSANLRGWKSHRQLL